MQAAIPTKTTTMINRTSSDSENTAIHKHIWNTLEDYFDPYNNAVVKCLIETYNQIDRLLESMIEIEPDIVHFPKENVKCTVMFRNVYIPQTSTIDSKRNVRRVKPLFPNEARMRNLDYDTPVHVDVIETIVNTKTGEILEESVRRREILAYIPVMVGSSKCRLSSIPTHEKPKYGECEKDPGGYFIANGKERALITHVRNAYNQINVAKPRKITECDKYSLTAEVRSMSEETGMSVAIKASIGHDGRTCVFSIPNVQEKSPIPVGIIFKALGFVEDSDIHSLINLDIDEDHPKFYDAMEIMKFISRDSFHIKTQQDALNYIGQHIIHNIPHDKRSEYAREVINMKLLPHLGVTSTPKERALYMGLIVKRLLRTHFGLRQVDDIDNIRNKRYETPAMLIVNLFRNLYKQFIKSLMTKKIFRAQKIVMAMGKTSIITKGIRDSMTSGNWGPHKNAYVLTGVSQILNRMTFTSSISMLRRINVPVGKESKTKKLREIHESQPFFIDIVDCFAPDTEVLMWNGTIKLATDIKVGDVLIDDKGNPTIVQKTTSGVAKMYEIKPKFGVNHTVTFNHILTLRPIQHKIMYTTRDNKFETCWFDKVVMRQRTRIFDTRKDANDHLRNIDDDCTIDIRIQDFLKLPKKIRELLVCFRSSGVNWPCSKTDRNPYVVGMHFVAGDSIPMNYIVNSHWNRFRLLAGIIDSATHVKFTGVEFVLDHKDINFLETIQFISRSLGLACNIHKAWSFRRGSHYKMSITGIDLHKIPSLHFIPRRYTDVERCIYIDEYMTTPFTVVEKNVDNFVGWQLDGSGRFLLGDFIATHNTPEGKNVGIVLSMCLLTRVTSRVPTHLVRDVLEKCSLIQHVNDVDLDDMEDIVPVLMNGVIVGHTSTPKKVVEKIQEYKRGDIFDENISVVYDPYDKEIQVLSDDGRLIRPVFAMNNGELCFTTKDKPKWQHLVDSHKIVYVDPSEVEMSEIAMSTQRLDGYHWDYCEIDPSMMLSISSAIIPYPDHNQAPRNLYQSSMGKQALGIPILSHYERADTLMHVMDYPQKPLVYTKVAKMVGCDDLPSGINAIVAVMLYTGRNQEDSIILNKSSVERGLFSVTSYKTHSYHEEPSKNYKSQKIETPDVDIRMKHRNYSLLGKHPIDEEELDENIWYRVGRRSVSGVIREGMQIRKNDVLVGKVLIQDSKDNKTEKKDISLIASAGDEGVVDRVYITRTDNGLILVKVVVRSIRIPEIGDKFACRSAQKGTTGLLMPQEDMPFNPVTGMTPDIIMNSHGFPSRMTVNQIIEMVVGKKCSLDGDFEDSTAFMPGTNTVAEKVGERLKQLGWDSCGREQLYCGMSGEPIEAMIYIGPTYYQRLKHLASDKEHARSFGRNTTLLRQPTEGRSRDGGLRFGEMERDGAISHGGASFLKDRLFHSSDPFQVPLCNKCKCISNNQDECDRCQGATTHTNIPYAAKQLSFLLQSMGIRMDMCSN